MKYADVDMQDMPSQSLLQAQSSENGTLDRGIRRSRTSDTTSNVNSSSSKAPEIIDLDGEDSPMENEEVPLLLNGVTTVRKVSMPWQRGVNSNTVDKKLSESNVESSSADCPTMEKGSVASKELSAPAEADEAVSNHAADGHFRLKKVITSGNHKVVKNTSISKKDEKVVVQAKKKIVGTKLPSSKHQGERKRPSLTGTDESDPKRPKIDNGAKSRVSSAKVPQNDSEGKESPKPSPRDSSEVSVVDLVEDDDEQERVSQSKGQDKSTVSDGFAKVDTTSDNRLSAVASGKKDSPVPPTEKKALSSAVPVGTTQAVSIVQNSNAVYSSNVSSEEKRNSLSAIISSGKNGLISSLPSIEVKKVKLCPQLEKQATAMSPLSLTPVVATPKQSTGALRVQIPVSITASTPEATEVPSLASSKALESAKEVVKEGEVVSGAELEKKRGLNPVHSETRKLVKRLTRSELESFFLEMACEFIIRKSDAGRYRQLYEEMKESCENKNNKIAQLNKRLVDLSAVVHRAFNDAKDKRDTVPVKITRSVGLQVKLSDDTPLGLPTAGKSPKRQLKALHPRPSPMVPQGNPRPPSNPSPSAPSPAPLLQDAPAKRLGFIDIADDKMVNSSQIGIRRHPAAAIIVTSASSSTLSPATAVSAVSSSQVMTSALKVIPSQFGRPATLPGNTFQTAGSNARVVTTAAIPVTPGTSISSPRLTYIIPTSSPIAVQPRQLVIQTAAQTQQMRGRSPVKTMPAMIMRPSTTLVQVPAGSITHPPPALIRAVQPSAAQQVLTAVKTTPQLSQLPQPPRHPQPPQPTQTPQTQQPPRILGMANRPSLTPSRVLPAQHPAPLPAQPQPTVVNSNLKPIPRRPVLKLSKVMNGIVLSWNMTPITPHEEIASYQLYAYQEGANAPPSPSLWKKVGDVKALPLPMACTLTQFADGHTYHFAVRAVDVHGRVGEFSVPGTIALFS